MFKKLIDNDPIMAVILLLIAVTIVFIAHSCVFMWYHFPLDAQTYDYWIKTQMFLGISLSTELLGGFGYNAYKHKVKKDIGIEEIQEESKEQE